jgi:hypothetical protein
METSFTTVFYLHDLLDYLLSFLNSKEKYYLMRCDQTLLKMIGMSPRWGFEIKNISKESEIIHTRDLCYLISTTSLIKSDIKIQRYYGNWYYWFRYNIILNRFDGYLCLYDILKCSDQQLQDFQCVIAVFCSSDKLILDKWDILIRNIHHLRTLKFPYPEILKKIVLSHTNYDLLTLIINVNNQPGERQYYSEIGYDISKYHRLANEFIIPKKKKQYNQMLIPTQLYALKLYNKYGDMHISKYRLKCHLGDYRIANYFSSIAERIDVNTEQLFNTVKLILKTSHTLFER